MYKRQADNVTQFELTAAEYEKYAKGVDVFYIYTPECELKYKSNNGILTAAFSGKEEYLYPHRFTENEMEGFKNVVIENSKDKIFEMCIRDRFRPDEIAMESFISRRYFSSPSLWLILFCHSKRLYYFNII